MNTILPTLIVVVALTVAAAVVTVIAADQTREQKLQQAIDLIESKGDLARALPLLEDAAKSTDPALAARALLYLAQTQERTNAAQARHTYERIVREFANQSETVAAARARVASLVEVTMAGANPRMIGADVDGVHPPGISWDGRFAAVASATDIGVRNMTTGVVTWLRVGAQARGELGPQPIISDDLQQVAYTVQQDNEPTVLRVVANRVGAMSRVLVSNAELRNISPVAWSRDARQILITFSRQDTWGISWVSVATGAVTPVRSFGWRFRPGAAGGISLSPDGRYVAYGALAANPTQPPPFRPSPFETRIYVTRADGVGEDVELDKVPSLNMAPVWTQDGAHIVFLSNRSGAAALWATPVRDGRPAGSASLVRANTVIVNSPVGMARMTRTGTYYYLAYSRTLSVSFPRLSSGSDGDATSPQSIVGWAPAWSADGRRMAVSRRGTRGVADLIVHTLDTGEEQAFRRAGLALAHSVWLPGGRGLLVQVTSDDLHAAWERLDLRTGQFREIVPADPGEVPGPGVVSPDDTTLYYTARLTRNGTMQDAIMAVDLESGHRRQLLVVSATATSGRNPRQNARPDLDSLCISPDGRTLAFRRVVVGEAGTRFWRIGTDGSDARAIYFTEESRAWPRPLGFSRDGTSILFVRTAEDPRQLMRLPVTGGNIEFTGRLVPEDLNGNSILSSSLSPDGSRIAISRQTDAPELWAIDGIASLISQ